ncbi:hypothetical protein [Antarctobacter jejuensis]
MKLLTLVQAAALLLLAVIGAYAAQDSGTPPCTAPTDVTVSVTCEL